MKPALYVGLMSGTSVDAIDSALIGLTNDKFELLATHQHPLPESIKTQIASLSQPADNEIERLGALDRTLGGLFSDAVMELLAQAGKSPQQIRAIGSHGQTIRHRPPSAGVVENGAFTLQIADPNTIAEITGITTVADFRRRDIAAGGEGAPLAPAFHAAMLARAGVNRAIVNIGGIANATLLEGEQLLMGFDTGPGNTLLDLWTLRHRGEAFDRDGQWSSRGHVDRALLEHLSDHPYFEKSGPRSTGKEAFNLDWLDRSLEGFSPLPAVDVQSTLAELTASSITAGITKSGLAVEEVFVCGGGAHNTDLMQRLARHLTPAALDSTATLGMDPDWVEAAAFAWLAHQALEGLAGNAPVVTGAAGPRVLGAIYPG